MPDNQESSPHSRFIVGLTGGIGSGKTTVANIFSSLGVEIIDADEISRDLVKVGSSCLDQIKAHFGSSVIANDGSLDRAALRGIVFANEQEKQWLENLLHPLVRDEIVTRVSAAAGDYVIIVVPLLVESGSYDFVDRILVVDVPEQLQIERIRTRDGSSEELIRQMLASQISREERLQHADDVIDNNTDMDALASRVSELHASYLAQATA